MAKFLIIRFSSIGDIVLTTPVIRCLKKQVPDAEVHFLTKDSFRSVIEHNPYIDKLHVLAHSRELMIEELKTEEYDYVIDLHHNQRTLLLKLLLGVKAFSFDKLNYEKWLMVNFKVNRLPDKHIVDRYIETCKALGVENDGEGLDYFISKEDEVDLKTLPEEFKQARLNDEVGQGYIAWVIGAKQNTKKFPAQKIVRTINKINYPVVLLGGKEDVANSELIIAKSTSNVYDFCGKLNLNQSASVVKQAHKVITHDTGLMHIAAAFHKDIITIWGNTIPEFGMTAYTENVENFEVKDLPCRPCSKIGHHECPKGHFKCMNGQNTEGVILYANK